MSQIAYRRNAANTYVHAVDVEDHDNDSVKANYEAVGGLQCKEVKEPSVASAVFAPPFWSGIQGGTKSYASLGRTMTSEASNESSYTTEQSSSVTSNFGVGIQTEGFCARVRQTAEEGESFLPPQPYLKQSES